MSWLSSFLHPGRGYEKSQDELNKYWQEAQQFQRPFVNNAQDTYGGLSQAFQALLNPGALQNEWANNYEESDYAKNLEHEAMDRGLNSAQSMGLGGSSAALQALQGGTQNIVGQERQQYLNDLMQKYMQAIGLGQNIYGTGANAAGNLANNAMQMGQNSAQAAYGQQNAPGSMFGKLLEGATTFATPFVQSWGMGKLGLNNTPWSMTGGR